MIIRNIHLRVFSFLASLVLLGFFSACDNNDPALPDNIASFEAESQGISPTEDELEVTITLSRAADVAIPITVSFATTGVTYGTDFTTTPAASGNNIVLTVPAGSATTSFTVTKTEDVLLDGDESIAFTIASATSPIVIGDENVITVTFAEILSAGATMDLTGGGSTYANKVFIDLSANRQTAVQRDAWDLGFYMGEDDFRVFLNSSTAMLARPLEKNDLTTVTAEDTIGFAEETSIAAFNNEAIAWIDAPDGALTGTAIASVSATASENVVYIVNRGSGVGTPPPALSWKKIRIIRNGTGYTLQHADIGSATFSEIQITKDDAYRVKYISFAAGAVAVEPAKTKWDIAWTYFTNQTNFGSGPIPYGFQDIVLQNMAGVQTAKILTATTAYAEFDESDLAGVTFSTSQLGIGSDWRITQPPTINADRYYIVKDLDGNYYKLKFLAITQDGERGRVKIEFALVKGAE